MMATYSSRGPVCWQHTAGLPGSDTRIVESDTRIGPQNRTPRIGHQADQERLGYSNYTKPTRIGHQADQEMLGYSN